MTSKPRVLELGRDRAGIVDRVGERRGAVTGIADDQRHTRLGGRRGGFGDREVALGLGGDAAASEQQGRDERGNVEQPYLFRDSHALLPQAPDPALIYLY